MRRRGNSTPLFATARERLRRAQSLLERNKSNRPVARVGLAPCARPSASLELLPGTLRLTRTRAKRRARCEWTRPHAEAWSQRRRHIAQKIAATRATTIVADRSCGVGTHPLSASFALRIDALHGKTGQKLHVWTPSEAGQTLCAKAQRKIPWLAQIRLLARILNREACGVKRKDYQI